MKTITTTARRVCTLFITHIKNGLRKGTYRLGLIGLGILALSLLAALLPVAISFAQGVSFGSATNYPVAAGGWNPHSVAVGDVNGDGKLDLAVADNNGNTLGQVSIFLGNGDSSFGAATNFAAQGGPVSVAMGDLNGDSKLDLAVVNHSSHSVSILLGVGDGSFSAATNYAVGTHPLSIAMGDLNGDGKADLAVANQDSNNVSILINNGSGSFSTAPNLAVGTNPRSIAMGDLNGDGKPDLAVANTGSHNISILLNSGSGSFGTATNFASVSGPSGVAIGDLNADGKPDLVVANDNVLNANVSILLNLGAGSFGVATYFGGGSGPSSFALGDFNGDGKQDLAVANYYGGNASILLGTGTGSFGSPASFGAGSGPISIAKGDFNGDEKPDLAVVNYWSHNVSILLNTCSQCTTPTISPVGLTLTEGSSSVNATIANVNDTEDAKDTLAVTVNGSATINGVTVSGITVNSAGVVTADIVAACNATTASFTLTVTDPGGLSTNATLTVTVNANAPPTLGTYLTASVNGSGSTTVPPNVPPSDNGSINSISTTSPSFTGGLSVNPATGVVTISNAGPGGNHTVTVTATDNCNVTATKTFLLTVNVNTPPSITAIANTRQPGASAMTSNIATVSDPDQSVGSLLVTFSDGSTSKTVNGVTVSSLTNTSGTISASIGADCTAAAASFTLKVTDSMGATATANLTVNVTANTAPVVTITGPASGSVYPIGTAVNFTGSFTDNTTGLYTAQWKYDSIVQAGTVNANAVSGAYTFTTAGVYLVSLSVADACGATGTASTLGELSALVVIYDPNGGFVTGGGWITSPAGAYVDNPALTGKANFGFVSKYQNGNSVPTGNTEFQFKAGNLNFSSTVYEWMVIAGARAQYKGSGKINGVGDYRFMLTAIDGQVNGGGGQDKFRIRIWNNVGGGLVYDNQMNAPDSADPTTVLGGGSIVIHK